MMTTQKRGYRNLEIPEIDIEAAISFFGSVFEMAKAIDVHEQSIYQWRARGKIPEIRLLQLAKYEKKISAMRQTQGNN